jgi:antirestriction protein ArdC
MNYGDRKATEVVEAIIEALETTNSKDWKAPWAKLGIGGHRNAFSKRLYRGFNPIWLAFVADLEGYTSSHWATFNQWKKAGMKVKKDTKSTPICFWQVSKYQKTLKDGTEEERKGFMFKVYNMINASCVEGWEEPSVDELESIDTLDHCEATIEATGATIQHGGDRAFFAPSLDLIQLPERDQFDSTEDYYATAFHELVHWTGPKSRLDREFGKRFGDNAYAFEELVAELGAVMLCAEHGIEAVSRPNHAQYIKGWIETLKADPKALWTAGSKAQQATDYILDFSNREEKTFEELAENAMVIDRAA